MVYITPKKVVGTGFLVTPQYGTTANLTLYVRTTGSDSNDGLTSGTALLTIQEAINRIPVSIGHTVVVDIGEGTFGGFSLPSKTYTAPTATLTIKGVTTTATGLASGTASGTATGGTITTLIDSGQSWTANDLRGRMALVDGEYRVIYSNDATSLVFVGPFTLTTNGKAYEIVEQKTILNTLGHTDSVVLLTGQVGCSVDGNWTLQDIKITTPSGASNYGLQYESTTGGTTNRVAIISQASQTGWRSHTLHGSFVSNDIYITGGATGFVGALCGTVFLSTPFKRVFCYNTSSTGVQFNYTPQVNTSYVFINSCPTGIVTTYCGLSQHSYDYIESCSTAGVNSQLDTTLLIGNASTITGCGIGVTAQGTRRLRVTGATIIQNSTSHGVYIGDSTNISNSLAHSYFDASSIINNGGSGIYARGVCQVYINSLAASGGTGNTRFGIELEDGAKAYVKTGIIANPLTGAMGDATVTDSKTPLTWATDFASNLATVADATGIGTAIKRRD